MVFQAYAVDEIQVGVHYLLWSVSAQHPYKQCHDAFHYQCVALGCEVQLSVHIVALQPHTALTTVDEVALRLVFLVQWLLLVAEVDEQLVFVHPIVES